MTLNSPSKSPYRQGYRAGKESLQNLLQSLRRENALMIQVLLGIEAILESSGDSDLKRRLQFVIRDAPTANAK